MFSQPVSWRNLGRDSTPKLSTRVPPFPPGKLPRDDRSQQPLLSRACSRARDREHASEIVRLVYVLVRSFSLGGSPSQRDRNSSRCRDTLRSGCSPERFLFTLTRKRAPRSSFLVYFVSMPWQCDITLQNRFPAGHFLRRHVDAKPFPRDYCVADFNASTCILRFAFGNEMCVNIRLRWNLVQRNWSLYSLVCVASLMKKSSLLRINFYNFDCIWTNKSNHFVSNRKW